MPWFFSDFDDKMILGFPIWAIYSISMTVVYAVIIAILLERYWDVSSSENESGEDG